jgi:hypothetical protein
VGQAAKHYIGVAWVGLFGADDGQVEAGREYIAQALPGGAARRCKDGLYFGVAMQQVRQFKAGVAGYAENPCTFR